MNSNSKSNTSLAKKMFLAMLAGLIFGGLALTVREYLTNHGQAATWMTINNLLFQDITAEGANKAIGLFYIIGQVFISCLQLVIVPMVFVSIVIAFSKISDSAKLGRLARKTLFLFMFTTLCATLFAGVIGYLVHKANLFSIQVDGIDAVQGTVAATNPLTIITGIVPTNILSAFSSNGGVLSVVFVAAVVGIILNQLNDKGSIIMKLCVEINDIIRIFLGFIVEKCAPIGIFALLSRTFATYGISQLKPAAMYILVVVATLLVYLFVGYAAYVAGFAKVNPLVFVKKVSEVMMFGFSTSSSAATLPLNKRVTTQDLGVSDDVASFVLPMGMTINMDGTAIMQVIAAIFVASIGGYELTFAKIIMIGLLAVVASIGTPAAPGAGGIILFTVLSGMGYNNDLALLAYSLILAINRPVEMLVTSLNVTGDAATAVMVAKSEGELDEEIFYSDDDDASFALAE